MGSTRLFFAFTFGLIAGLAGETILFLERQCGLIEGALREDFRILLFLPGELEEGRQKVLEEQLLALPDVSQLRAVRPQEALAALRREDPELVEAVTLLTENPLKPAYEVRLDEQGLGRFEGWLAQARSLHDWADIRYKPAQVQAILQAQFYRHIINLASSAVVCLAAFMALAWLWSVVRPGPRPWHAGAAASWMRGPHPWILGAAAAGTLLGAGLVLLAALPMRVMTPWWSWPAPGRQALLAAGAALVGWILCRRDP